MNIFGPSLRLWRLLAQFLTIVGQKQVSLIAAGVAFFGMFAVFPASPQSSPFLGFWPILPSCPTSWR